MRAIRAFISWIFALAALSCLGIAIRYVRLDFFSAEPWQQLSILRRLIVPVAFSLQGTVFAMAWWTGFREKSSMRGWGIAASALLLLAALFPIILILWFDQNWSNLMVGLVPFSIVLAAGIAGLVAFGKRIEVPDKRAEVGKFQPVPGDGTSRLLSRSIGLLTFATGYAAYSWWLQWARSRGFELGSTFLGSNLVFFAILGILMVIHECGHAVAALALGMGLRSYAIGPFQFRREKCKWRFEFNPRLWLRRDGAVGVLLLRPRSPRWHHVCVAAGGPAANLVSGVIALFIAMASNPDATVQMDGALALFGAFSISIGISNLIPFRVGEYYSDGARCYQHLVGHPCSDWMRVMQAVMAVLETSLRTRDYDLAAIDGAFKAFPRGMEGHYLRLYAYDYYFEQGQINEACGALKEAESIYDASELKAETEISFVLGYACLQGDASSARRWWERLEARKPDPSDAGYWLAKCALDRLEGHLEDSIEALENADRLIAELPRTGSRAYDETWSSRLRDALDRSAVAITAISE